jgi:hypothetical protein
VALLEDACRPVDVPPGNLNRALEEMRGRGVLILDSEELKI